MVLHAHLERQNHSGDCTGTYAAVPTESTAAAGTKRQDLRWKVQVTTKSAAVIPGAPESVANCTPAPTPLPLAS